MVSRGWIEYRVERGKSSYTAEVTLGIVDIIGSGISGNLAKHE